MTNQAATQPLTLLGTFIRHLEFLNHSRETIVHYKWSVQRLLRFYPGVPVDSLTPEHLERHLSQRHASPRTRALELKHLRIFFGYLVRDMALLKENPAAKVTPPKWHARARPAPSFRDVESIMRQCQTSEEAVVVRLYFQTAIRLREGLSLRVGNVNLEERTIRLVGKGGEERVVAFDPSALGAFHRLSEPLQAHIQGREAWEPVLGYGEGSRSARWINETLRRLGREAGIPYKVTVHVLRHAWVRWAKTSGLPLTLAQKQLGHKDVRTTDRLYGQVENSDLREGMDRFLKAPGL